MISVCMATYNGASFIEEQLYSILRNLSANDEVIISDDGSSDETRTLIEHIMEKDSRIRLLNGPKKGIIANFENAIVQAKGEIIFLSDQDDVWCDNKVSKVLDCFADERTKVVVHDAYVVNEYMEVLLPSYFGFRKSGSGFIKNIIRNSFVGCCMAFRKDLFSVVIPIPKNIEMHDQWIGICGEMNGQVVFLKDRLLYYRRHGDNSSELNQHHSLFRMIRNRMLLCINLACRLNHIKI